MARRRDDKYIFDERICFYEYNPGERFFFTYQIDDRYHFLCYYSERREFEELSGFGIREKTTTRLNWWRNEKWKEI